MKKLLYVLSLILLPILLISCWNTINKESENMTKANINAEIITEEKKVVKVWVLLPLSWWAATYWIDAVNAYNMILENINTKLDENWNIIELIVEDSKCNWKDGVAGINKLISIDKVDVILWALCSSATIPSAKIAQAKKIPMVSALSSAPAISDIWKFIYRFYNDLDATKKVNEFMKLKWAKKIAIIVENTDYWVGYWDALKNIFDWEIVFYDKFESNEKDFSILAKKVKSNLDNIDFLIFVPNNENTTIWTLKALKNEWVLSELTWNWKIIWTEVPTTEWILKEMWDDMNWFYWTKLIDDVSILWDKTVKFIKNYKSKYEIWSSEFFVTLDVEAMNLIWDAVLAWNYSSTEIQNYLQLIWNWSKRNGYFWEYYFDENWDAVWLEFLMWIVKNGKLETVE